jgi:hypothetical protein
VGLEEQYLAGSRHAGRKGRLDGEKQSSIIPTMLDVFLSFLFEFSLFS